METNEKAQENFHILLVDDDEGLCKILTSFLTENGYQADAAKTAEEALTLFEKGRYPVVLTDISLKGMGGIELLEKINGLDSNTQVILSTNNASLNTVLPALRAGAYDYIMKPFDELDHVAAVINRALEKSQLVSENKYLLDELKVSNQALSSQNEKLKEMAIQDGLTGLYNHRFFQENLTKNILLSDRSGLPCSLVFMDIDHFKQYNDTYGHPAGDEVLKQSAKLMSAEIRASDLAARYGGEEFVLLLPGTDKTGALTLAEKIRQRVESHSFQGRDTQPLKKVTVSIGVATCPDDASEAETLLNIADKALYKAKESGRNRICVAEEV